MADSCDPLGAGVVPPGKHLIFGLQLPPLPDEALAALVCTLAESGVGVVGLTAQTKSLEDIFLSLTQTSGEVA